MYVTFIVLVILVTYIFCALYNLAWLTFSNLGALSRVMSRYRTLQRKTKGKDKLLSDKELLGDLWDVYYNNRDLKLLLDLLAESSGISTALRIIALFDKRLRCKIQPCNVQVKINALPASTAKEETAQEGPETIDQDQFHSLIESRSNSVVGASGDGGPVYEVPGPGTVYAKPNKNNKQANGGLGGVALKRDVYDAIVEFEDAEAIEDMFSCIKNLSYLYTIEITPPTSSTSVQSIRIGEDGEHDFFLSVHKDMRVDTVDSAGAETLEISNLKPEEGAENVHRKKMQVPLIGLEVDTDYTVRISTIVNGRTIARKVERIKALQPKKSENGEKQSS